MIFIKKYLPAILLLLAGVTAAIGSFISSKGDQDQKDVIEALGKQNLLLSTQIANLSKINNTISLHVQEITEENSKLTIETKSLIEEVNDLTEKTKVLISRIDKRTAYATEENLQTGQLKLSFGAKTNDTDAVVVKHGGVTVTNSVQAYKQGAQLFLFQDKEFIHLDFDQNNNLLFSLKIYDLEGNLLAEIEKNNWRPNKNFIGKFNYDERGFEVIDNKGNIAININILSHNTIEINGVFAENEAHKIIIWGRKHSTSFPFKTPKSELEIKNYLKKGYDIALKEAINKADIPQLFEYTGSDWLHKRKTK